MKTSIARLGRLSLLALWFVAGPLQAAVPMLACATMDVELRGACCCADEPSVPCDEPQGAQLPVTDSHCGCCEISLTPIDSGDAAAAGGSWQQPATGPPPQSPSAVALEHSGESFLPPADDLSAASTYLLTARLRL